VSAVPFARPEPPPREPRVRYEKRRGTVAVFFPAGAVEIDLGALIVSAGIRKEELMAMVVRHAHAKGLGLHRLGWARGFDGRGTKKRHRVASEDGDLEP
jgi:hypothetical protein